MLGGTSEARALAAELVRHGVHVVSSLAGRVRAPRLPDGEVRIGGFGGARGLATWLRETGVRCVVDATHPFASRISQSAASGTGEAGVPLLRLERAGWHAGAADDWRWAGSLDEAAQLCARLGTRIFLTTGRQGLAAFAGLDQPWFLIRCVDPPDPPLPARCEVVLDRGPYTVDGEIDLMRQHGIDLLVTKDSGGTYTAAKLDAARRLGVPVVVVRRPSRPRVHTVETVDEAAAWVLAHAGAIGKASKDEREDGI
ncbi:cobalt-precorrin-6A reductase [Actinobacteria bacterium YIM 96077]|uniref:Cobalt-precorrin-6A reductase n=1 Tax=Phytoactinopolyspora halophila TaxID=1981511 RepID=A0A329QPC6_9ACTN|nr:cobalt-precorrin-6A reductase [Actinobacteria bacterium YIM 96077]RAW14227.1 cobalt-precorrin-6A reductase [Phytoactinopolyspora halophila]